MENVTGGETIGGLVENVTGGELTGGEMMTL